MIFQIIYQIHLENSLFPTDIRDCRYGKIQVQPEQADNIKGKDRPKRVSRQYASANTDPGKHHGQEHQLPGKMIEHLKRKRPQRQPVQKFIHEHGHVGNAVIQLVAVGKLRLALLEELIVCRCHIVRLFYHMRVKYPEKYFQENSQNHTGKHTYCHCRLFRKHTNHFTPLLSVLF